MTCRVAIIGGGPGGLMTAYLLQQRCQVPVAITIYEASERLGGKILTEKFAHATPGAKAPGTSDGSVNAKPEGLAYPEAKVVEERPDRLAYLEAQNVAARYEAGAAELYDYSVVGEDPLRELVEKLGLTAKPMGGRAIVLDDQILNDFADAGRVFGEKTRRALEEFDGRAREWMGPKEYYDSDWKTTGDPMAGRTFEAVLEQVPDEAARRYLRTMVHSDLATEPEKTSAAYGLQNYLMNDPAYMRLYAIEGGNERLAQELAAQVEARVLLKEPVTRVERQGEQLRVRSGWNGSSRQEDYDYVVVALPHDCLTTVEWAGEGLGEAMKRHVARHDHPANYLRVSVLFSEIFWEEAFHESYMMLEAFGGCCLYDESSRNGCRTNGVLSWLIAGDAAAAASEASDEELIGMALDSLPAFLERGSELYMEGWVHRWIGAVSGMPAGSSGLDMDTRHIPEPEQPNLFVVGDYLFDATLNGVLDSADYVTECLAEEIEAEVKTDAPEAAGATKETTGAAL